jgi:hypothetical protein
MLTLTVLFRQGQFRKADVMDLDLAWLDIDHTAIACHIESFLNHADRVLGSGRRSGRGRNCSVDGSIGVTGAMSI